LDDVLVQDVERRKETEPDVGEHFGEAADLLGSVGATFSM
jgi:hypothetical protein